MLQRLRAAPDARWNFWVLGLDVAFFTLAINISSLYTIMPLFVHQLTPLNWPITLITTLRMLGSYAPTLLIAGYVERLHTVKPLILLMTIGERLPFLLLAIAVVLLSHHNDILLLIFFYMMLFTITAAGGLCFSPWLDLISRTIPGTMRGRFLGGWSGIGNIFGIGGAAVATKLLTTFQWPWSFAACFALSFCFMIVSFGMLAQGREPIRTDVHRVIKTTGSSFTRGRHWVVDMRSVVVGDRAFRRYLGANALSGTSLLGSGLLAIVALRQAHLTNQQVIIETTVVLFATMIGNFLWGFIGDRFGHRAVLVWSSASGTCAMLLTLIAHSVLAMTLAFFFFALGTAGVALAQLTYVIDFGPPARRPVYIGLAFILLAPFATLAPLIGGIMADQWGYAPVFVIAATLSLGTTLTYWLWVHDPVPQTAITNQENIARLES